MRRKPKPKKKDATRPMSLPLAVTSKVVGLMVNNAAVQQVVPSAGTQIPNRHRRDISRPFGALRKSTAISVMDSCPPSRLETHPDTPAIARDPGPPWSITQTL